MDTSVDRFERRDVFEARRQARDLLDKAEAQAAALIQQGENRLEAADEDLEALRRLHSGHPLLPQLLLLREHLQQRWPAASSGGPG